MAKVSLAGALRIAREELERAEVRVVELRTEVRGLELALARHHAHTTPTSRNGDTNSNDGARTEAVLVELLSATQPLSPSQIATAISQKRERPERPRDIGAALSY